MAGKVTKQATDTTAEPVPMPVDATLTSKTGKLRNDPTKYAAPAELPARQGGPSDPALLESEAAYTFYDVQGWHFGFTKAAPFKSFVCRPVKDGVLMLTRVQEHENKDSAQARAAREAKAQASYFKRRADAAQIGKEESK